MDKWEFSYIDIDFGDIIKGQFCEEQFVFLQLEI